MVTRGEGIRLASILSGDPANNVFGVEVNAFSSDTKQLPPSGIRKVGEFHFEQTAGQVQIENKGRGAAIVPSVCLATVDTLSVERPLLPFRPDLFLRGRDWSK
jgi:hypothetical protein